MGDLGLVEQQPERLEGDLDLAWQKCDLGLAGVVGFEVDACVGGFQAGEL